MKFRKLSTYLNRLENTASRIEITKILADLFENSDRGEVDKITYLLLGSLAPRYKSIVFNIADRVMIQILADAYNEDENVVKKLFKEKGDLGEVADVLAQSSKTKTQEAEAVDVYDLLVEVAKEEGVGSQERKVKKSADLISKLDPLSAKFVVRIILGKLRLGFSDKTILDAVSWMEAGDKSKKAQLEGAYNVLPDVGLLVKNVKAKGTQKAVSEITPVVGTPVQPALAQRLKSPAEMIKKMEEVAVEPKFDGLRIQIHFQSRGFENGRKVKAYTRNLNETSWMFPELDEAGKFLNADEIILDCEAIGVDEKTKALANFQTTMTRRRKHDIAQAAKNVGIKFYVFDVLYKDGKSLMEKSYLERRKELKQSIAKSELLEIVDYKVTKNSQDIEKMMRLELAEGLEGIIVKRVDGRYVAGRTGWRWVKMKEEESAKAKLADTVDCVVMGYSVGKGKRAQFGVGQFLVGVKGEGKIKTISKVGTGITDEQFGELKERLDKLEVKKKPMDYKVDKLLIPDYWVEPRLVVEIAADEITKSPSHTSKYALRFPRLIRFRDDKSAFHATTINEIKKLFELQK